MLILIKVTFFLFSTSLFFISKLLLKLNKLAQNVQSYSKIIIQLIGYTLMTTTKDIHNGSSLIGTS